uniref:(California timema) hypothetical protein n=1 Tax=Timema californicum TaxID=61474 RepID=A0A7R9IZK1_TIMCA|nr:unnamed protein product [Timema californicum]
MISVYPCLLDSYFSVFSPTRHPKVLRKVAVSTNSKMSTGMMGNLDVVIPPDILNDEETTDGGVAPENGSVRLRCKATGVPEPMVLWRREDSKTIVLRHDGGREKQDLSLYSSFKKPHLIVVKNFQVLNDLDQFEML